MGNLTKLTDALGHVRSMSLDKVGNLVGYTNAAQQSYAECLRRDESPHCADQFSGGQYKTQYNGNGIPIRETDEDGRGHGHRVR